MLRSDRRGGSDQADEDSRKADRTDWCGGKKMTERDDLQELWQSQEATAIKPSEPHFDLLEDLGGPVRSAVEIKWWSVVALVLVMGRSVLQLYRSHSTPELAACVAAIACACMGILLVVRQTSRPLTDEQDLSVEEFRTAVAREYERQTRNFRRSFVPALMLKLGLSVRGASRWRLLPARRKAGHSHPPDAASPTPSHCHAVSTFPR